MYTFSHLYSCFLLPHNATITPADSLMYIRWGNMSAGCQATGFGRSCTLYLGVRGYPGMPPGRQAQYTVRGGYAGSPLFPTSLQSGYPLLGAVLQGGYGYFTTQIAAAIPARTLYCIVTNAVGSTELFLNLGYNTTFATAENGVPAAYHIMDEGGFEHVVISPMDAPAPPQHEQPRITSPTTPYEEAEAAGPLVYELMSVNGGRAFVDPAVDGLTVSRYAPEVMRGYQAARAAANSAQYASSSSSPADVFANDNGRNGVVPDAEEEAESADATEAARSAAGIVGAGRYCNNCPLFASVRGATDAAFVIQYTSGVAFEQLRDDVTIYREVGGLPNLAFFTFAATDPNADVTFTITQYAGAVEAWVGVISPANPQVMPTPTRFQFVMQPWATGGFATLTLNHTATGFCVSGDRGSLGPPCTYGITIVTDGGPATAGARAGERLLLLRIHGVRGAEPAARGEPLPVHLLRPRGDVRD